MRRFTIALLVLLVAGMNFAFAQTRTISGTVTSSDDGSKLPGVTIRVKGTNVGTITGQNGNYSLKVGANAKVLVFSFVGMKTQEIAIKGRNVINVSMASSTTGLNEVVVMGYATKSKSELTSSAVQVSGASIDKVPVTTSTQALQGKVPGLEISSNSGTPGTQPNILIRGMGSITASNAPLIVVDGVPVVNGNASSNAGVTSSLSELASIDPNDIASITVLKDAASTAAYGARGSNGVIVITTKSGRRNEKTVFNFSTYIGYQNKAVPGEQMLNGNQKKTLLEEAIRNTFQSYYSGTTLDDAYNWGLSVGLIPTYLANWNGKSTNWGDVVTNKNAPIRSYNLSASGGDKISSFYASVGYNKTEGTVIGSSFKRISASLDYTRQLTKKLKLVTNNLVTHIRQNSILEQSAYFSNPEMVKYFGSPWDAAYNSDGTININNFNGGGFNPLWVVKHDINYSDFTRGMTNSSLEYSILRNFKFKTLISLDYRTQRAKAYQNPIYGDGASVHGDVDVSVNQNITLVAQNSLDYTYRFHDNTLSFKALMEYQKNKNNYLEGYGQNIPVLGLTNLSTTSASWQAFGNYYDWANLSYLGMMNYNYMGKYLLNFTFRREGSSRFAAAHRYGNFWAVGAGWNLAQESFIKNIKFINLLKLRGSYGLSGNAAIALNTYQELLNFNETYNGSSAAYSAQLGNQNLTWERNKTLDFGLDFTLWNSRINGSVDYYHKKTYDLLQSVPLSLTTGFTSQNFNVGTVINKGIEANLSVDIIHSAHLSWSMSGNFATVHNEVTALAKGVGGTYIDIDNGYANKTDVGHPINAWYIRKWAGVDPQTGDPLFYVNGKSGATTTHYYSAKRAYAGGSPLPTYTGSISTHIDYRGFFVNASVYFSGGNKILQDWTHYTWNPGVYSALYFNGVTELMNAWTTPGQKTNVPKMEYAAPNSSRASTRFLYSGDYARLKNLTFGYNVPKKWLSHIKFDGATVYVRGSNIFTWVKDKRLKYDPEVGADGLTMLTTPPVKSIVFGVNLKF